jgi:hypothetical protein
MLLVFVVFWGLTVATFWGRSGWQLLSQRSRSSWILDTIGLFIQGFVIPILQVVVIGKLYGWVLPGWQGTIVLSPVLGFLLNFVAIDYLYYWNHRLLHGKSLWPLHQVHHSVTTMKQVRWLPPLHMTYAYKPLRDGRTEILPIYVTAKREGPIGWLKSQFLLTLTRLTYYFLRGEDGQIYDNIRFAPNALLPIDAPLVHYMNYVNQLSPSCWSRASDDV